MSIQATSVEENNPAQPDAIAAGGKVHPAQEEMPFAMVQGKELTVVPKDLYIPPDALEVFLEAFEGPLDLLLYLIRRQNLDILEINVAEITQPIYGLYRPDGIHTAGTGGRVSGDGRDA